MPRSHHPIDRLLRALAGSSSPDQAEVDRARQRLEQEFTAPPPISGRARRRPLLAWGAAAIAVGVVFAIVFRPGETSPAVAAMEEIATLAENVDPVEATDERFIYTRGETTNLFVVPQEGLSGVPFDRENLVYYENAIRESWFGGDDTVQISITVLEPSFLSDQDENVYFAAGLDEQDRVGETITSMVVQPDQTVWPTDPNELDQAIRETMVSDRGLPSEVEYLDTALDIVRESHASPELRAATLRLIGPIEGLQLEQTEPDGTSTFTIEYVEQDLQKRLTFTIDTSGYLRFEEKLRVDADPILGTPAGAIESSSTWGEPTTTGDLEPAE